jgi:phenylalanyl-tRNA synthetase beta chain
VKVLLSWLKEFVDVDASGDEIGARLSLRGFALEGIERLPNGDQVLDFDVTGNRPDCMNVVGLAREVAATYGQSLSRRPALTPPAGVVRGGDTVSSPDITISIDNTELCRVYAGAVADVTVAPSPAWMQERLKASGIRPISNIVDITNYVLLELGQPMHAFDITRLGGRQIRVRTARTGERLTTLDGQDRELTPDMLIIADAEQPVAVAGVMGGADSEVNDRTTTIVFESAYFDPLSVRRTSRKLGMKTEASMRFERGADRALPPVALVRALTLMEETGAGTARGIAVAGDAENLAPRMVALRRARITGLLGTSIPDDDVFRILGSLGFTSEPGSDGWNVTVPPRRVDIHREVDLIEELARHHGFDRIPSHFPALTVAPAAIDPRITRARQLRAVMTGAGFSEAVTFGFISAAAAAPFSPEGEVVAIANPLSETFGVLRPSALPGLLDAVAHNRRRQQGEVRLFEIGNRFTRDGGERRALACVWTGAATGTHWTGGSRSVDFFDAKGLAERICDALGVVARVEASDTSWLVPGRAATLIAGSAPIGIVGQLSAQIIEQHGVPAQDVVYAVEVDLDAVALLPPPAPLQIQPLPRFPSVTRDISILVADTLAAGTVRETIRHAAPGSLSGVVEFDRYQGKGVPDGSVSLSLRLTFRSAERTLTDADVQSAMDAILAALKQEHGATQR